MTVINELSFFFTAFGNVLRILGMILVIALPAGAICFWLGWKLRKLREPSQVTQAISTAKEAERALVASDNIVTRAIRMYKVAEANDNKSAQFTRMASANRDLAMEILSKKPIVDLKLVVDEPN